MIDGAAPTARGDKPSWLLGGALALGLHGVAGLLLYDVNTEPPGTQQQAALTYELEPLLVEPEPVAPVSKPFPPSVPADGGPSAPANVAAADTAAQRETAARIVPEAAGATKADTSPPAEQLSPPLPDRLEGPPPSLRAIQPVDEIPQAEPTAHVPAISADGAVTQNVEAPQPVEQLSVPLPEQLDGPPPLLRAPTIEPVQEPKPPVPVPAPAEKSKVLPKAHNEAREPPPRPSQAKAKETRPAKAAKPKGPTVPQEAPAGKQSKTNRKADPPRKAVVAGQGLSSGPARRQAAGQNAASDSGGSAGTSPARWQAEVNAHIRRFRQYPAGAPGSAAVHVQFRINANGVVKSVSIVGSSGNPSLDRAAADTVRRASPVPAPPPGIARQPMTLAITITFKR
jgi:protein TonB